MRRRAIFLLIASALVLCLTVTAAFAIWEDTRIALQTVPVKTDKWNESEKYIIFAGLDSEGGFASSEEDIVSLAAVGYTGIVSTLEIPETTTVNIAGVDTALPVVAVKYPPLAGLRFLDGAAYVGENAPLANNYVITKLIISATVAEIDSYVFLGNKYLAEIEIITKPSTETTAYPTDLTLGAVAFGGCMDLAVLKNEGSRNLDAGENTLYTVFEGCQIVF